MRDNREAFIKAWGLQGTLHSAEFTLRYVQPYINKAIYFYGITYLPL